jgi:tetratricopeptide (TPR) repeat protein
MKTMVQTLVLVILLACPLASAQMPPKAGLSLQRGLAAAKLKDWPSASRHFLAAAQKAPKSAKPFMYLGAAHQRMRHHIQAAAALRAYLELETDEAKRRAALKDIIDLEVAAENRARDLFREAMAAVDQIPKGSQRKAAANGVLRELLMARELEWALEMVHKEPIGAITLMGQLAEQCAFADRGLADWLLSMANKASMIEGRARARRYRPQVTAMAALPVPGESPQVSRARRLSHRKMVDETRRKLMRSLTPILEEFSREALLMRFSGSLAAAGLHQSANNLLRRSIKKMSALDLRKVKNSSWLTEMVNSSARPITVVRSRHDFIFLTTDGVFARIDTHKNTGWIRAPRKTSQPAKAQKQPLPFASMVITGLLPTCPQTDLGDQIFSGGGISQQKQGYALEELPVILAAQGRKLLLAVKFMQR